MENCNMKEQEKWLEVERHLSGSEEALFSLYGWSKEAIAKIKIVNRWFPSCPLDCFVFGQSNILISVLELQNPPTWTDFEFMHFTNLDILELVHKT